MIASKFVMDTVMAIASHYAQKGIEITFEKAKEIIGSVCEKDPSLKDEIDLDEMAKSIQERAGQVGREAYTQEKLARFLEVPVSDLRTISPESVDTRILYDHVKLEGEFEEWLKEWGYDVELGKSLQGLKGIEFTPDVYGRLCTLHGEFEICINFVSDLPPSEDRVFALLGKIEAYAEARKTFSFGDIFLIVTPRSGFSQGGINAIRLQNEQENYLVLALDGEDVFTLEDARTGAQRLKELQDKVKQAEMESDKGKERATGNDCGGNRG